jgi:hypothetical protein
LFAQAKAATQPFQPIPPAQNSALMRPGNMVNGLFRIEVHKSLKVMDDMHECEQSATMYLRSTSDLSAAVKCNDAFGSKIFDKRSISGNASVTPFLPLTGLYHNASLSGTHAP